MEYVNLYTRQHENSLFELDRKGEITNKKLYVLLHLDDTAPFFLEKYDHFVKMAAKIVPRTSDANYPIWCSVSKNNCLKPIDKTVVYAITVPKNEVIYFDGAKWDLVLNNQYISKDEKDENEFKEIVKAYGLEHSFDIFDRKYIGAFDDLKKKIVDSWSRIFEITDRSEFVVQANIWRIKKDWVKHIIHPGEDFFEIVSDMKETWEE